ncbi:hypothetical protein NLI96_g10187 [Meripilus lineatus]|uniref:Uncharacterized protein n=1 Tax=Meripilus lineatus TaxID=2056292 RepID=A0AAD5UU37_9APHY|nr:hypothetical protein NLI96_g10187 [Physisporinus lineatus]
MPSDTIRSLLVVRANLGQDAILPKQLESLLNRLSSFEFRTLYVRFGQNVLQDCEHCKTFDEYALNALPGPLLQYIREAFIIGLITITGSFRERWRTYAIGALVIAAVVEGYYTLTADITIPKDGRGTFMLHDTLWTLRHIFFLLLPLLIHTRPPTPPIDTTFSLIQTHETLKTHLTRLTSLKYMRGALMRDPQLRASAAQWWDNQRINGAWVREDLGIQKLADKLGYGYTNINVNPHPNTPMGIVIGGPKCECECWGVWK